MEGSEQLHLPASLTTRLQQIDCCNSDESSLNAVSALRLNMQSRTGGRQSKQMGSCVDYTARRQIHEQRYSFLTSLKVLTHTLAIINSLSCVFLCWVPWTPVASQQWAALSATIRNIL